MHPARTEDVDDTWTFYVIEGRDKTWYAGVTVDFDRRLRCHNANRGARYTRGRGPFVPVFRLGLLDKEAAMRAEARFKKLTRKQKEALVAGDKELMNRILPVRVCGIRVWRQDGN